MLYYLQMERQRKKLIRYVSLAVTAFLAGLGIVLFLALRGEGRLETGFALPRITPTPEITATPYREPEETATPKPTKTPKPGHGGGNYGHGVEGLIKAAESRVGCPYVRGGKGPDSFDCSGLVYWCLKQAGVNISYMTSVRWRTCSKFTRIDDMDKLQKGDILVFSGSSESSGHVGIYIGSGRMIDASSSAGSVVKRSVSTKYWTNHFLMAYRIW